MKLSDNRFINNYVNQFKLMFKNFLGRSILLKCVSIGLCVSCILSAVVIHKLYTNCVTTFSSATNNEANLLLSVAEDYVRENIETLDSNILIKKLNYLFYKNSQLLYIHIYNTENNLDFIVDRPVSSDEMFQYNESTNSQQYPPIVLEHTIDDSSLTILVAMDTRQIYAKSHALVLRIAGWLFFCIVLVHVVLLAFGYYLMRPAHELLCATKSLQNGNLKTRAKVYCDDEIGKLAKGFNELALNLQLREEEVHEKEQARLSLMKRFVHNQESERKMLARNLHDEIGQSLSHLLIKVNGLCQKCSNTPELSTGLTQLIDETRQLAWDFRPSILDDYGLDSALKRYAQEHLTPLNIDVKCESINFDLKRNCCCQVPGEIEVTLYRIAQEALTNIIRHADAKHVSVILIRNNCNITLILEDDGCGFDFESSDNGGISHLGIIGMRERAQLIGGDLTIESLPGEGTIVRVTVSLKQVAV